MSVPGNWENSYSFPLISTDFRIGKKEKKDYIYTTDFWIVSILKVAAGNSVDSA